VLSLVLFIGCQVSFGHDVETSPGLSLSDYVLLRANYFQLHALVELTLLKNIQTLKNVDFCNQFLALSQLIDHPHMQNSCKLRSRQCK
jgi:hypothetical protein